MELKNFFSSLIFAWTLIGTQSLWANETPWKDLSSHAWKSLGNQIPQTWYQKTLRRALSRIIPHEKGESQLTRINKAIESGVPGRTERDQVLSTYRISDLKGFFAELNGRLDGDRSYLTQAERKFENKELNLTALNQLRARYTSKQLSTEELAVIIHFYRAKDPSTLLIRNGGIHKSDTEVIRAALQATRFPPIPLHRSSERKPGEPRLMIPFTASMRYQWEKIYTYFKATQQKEVFDEIWSQLVNQNVGYLKFRHLAGFEESFLKRIREIALTSDALRAKKLFLAYLSNYNSSQFLDRYGEDPEKWPEKMRDLKAKPLAHFIARFSKIQDLEVLKEVFRAGHLPDEFGKTNSTQIQRALFIFANPTQSFDCRKKIQSLAS